VLPPSRVKADVRFGEIAGVMLASVSAHSRSSMFISHKQNIASAGITPAFCAFGNSGKPLSLAVGSFSDDNPPD